jgi:hypothetical protein
MALLSFRQPHWEALTTKTRDAFHLLSDLEMVSRFYLAGGTGLALHLGHRFSVDLDFFCDRSDAVNSEERSILRQAFADPTLAIIHDKDSTFVATWQGVGISFFRLNLYPLARQALTLEKIPVASLEEIGAMKLAAIIDRGMRKDLVDLYFILRQVPLENLFEVASVKYSRVRTFAVSAVRAMAYFDDAEALPMPIMLDKTPWSKMKRFLEGQAMEAGREQLQDLWNG